MTKPPRTALPLPRYVERRWTKAGWTYHFHVPTWAKRAGCPMHTEALGSDLDAAIKRAETILLPAFDAWRSGDAKIASGTAPAIAAVGTLDWVFAEVGPGKGGEPLSVVLAFRQRNQDVTLDLPVTADLIRVVRRHALGTRCFHSPQPLADCIRRIRQ